MSKSKWLNVILIVLFVLVNCVCGVDVKGDIIQERVAPGGHISHEIDVSLTPTEKTLNFSIEIKGISMSLEGSPRAVEADKDDYIYSARSFLSVSPASFSLGPGDSQKILLEGDVPNDVGSGTRYAMLQIRSVPEATNNTQTGAVGVINLPIILEISGTDQIRSGEISELKLGKPISPKELNLSLTFENTGNAHFKAQIKADLLNESKEVLASVSIPLSTASIFPTMPRLFKFSIAPDEELKPGAYSINATVNLVDDSVLASKEVDFKI
jgi:hypothetical protein